ncbi:MAG: HPF/RaiA family ribosome-associated protein [Saprospiraceae bacterium]|nr:HPF/RaiA family ribosome-associated protein [Saprospiraceae bacterium]MCB9314269.1 HPF/RaiA family ribosome-associated protein [Lewinellaceae bacterium]
MKIETQSIHFTADQKLLDFIEKKLNKLDTLNGSVQRAEVILRLENSGQVRDKIAEIKLHIPGASIFSKQTAKTFETAVEKSVSTLRRQILRFKERKGNARRRRSATA